MAVIGMSSKTAGRFSLSQSSFAPVLPGLGTPQAFTGVPLIVNERETPLEVKITRTVTPDGLSHFKLSVMNPKNTLVAGGRFTTLAGTSQAGSRFVGMMEHGQCVRICLEGLALTYRKTRAALEDTRYVARSARRGIEGRHSRPAGNGGEIEHAVHDQGRTLDGARPIRRQVARMLGIAPEQVGQHALRLPHDAHHALMAVHARIEEALDRLVGEREAAGVSADLLLGDAHEAEDVAQEVFLRAFRTPERFDPDRPLRPWLLRSIVGDSQRTAWYRCLRK